MGRESVRIPSIAPEARVIAPDAAGRVALTAVELSLLLAGVTPRRINVRYERPATASS